MTPVIWAIAISTAVFVGTLLALEAGYRFGADESKSKPQFHEGINAVEASAFALFGLLLAFSFAAAASRLDVRAFTGRLLRGCLAGACRTARGASPPQKSVPASSSAPP